ncbi:hypothetical protein ACS0TY_014537 [Phlomoides rotata]
MKQHHFLLTCLPAQGHINPTLQLAKNLTRLGATVTFATTARGLRGLNDRLPTLDGLSYASFSDGYDDDATLSLADITAYMASLKRVGSQDLTNILQKCRDDGKPVTCVVYTLLMPWVPAVARGMHVPSAFLAIQCATAFTIYHRYFINGMHEPSISIEGLPLFTRSDLPTFILPDNPMYPLMLEQIQELDQNPNSLVLLNTFEELEQEAIKALIDKKMNAIAIGPLIPSAFSDGNDSTDKSFGADLFTKNDDAGYFEWLDSKPEKSVVYVAFGSVVEMDKEGKMEILHGLLESKRPFLWVIRSSDSDEEEKKMLENEENNGDGMIVPWCSQVEVLSHKSVGCFITHCGWNSTLESLVCGVPVIGCPQNSDQTTNAKMVQEVWGNGVRARENGDVVIKREEFKKWLEVVMGDCDRGREIRNNALKWRGLAVEAGKDGGSTYNNLRKVLEMNLI